MVTAWLSCLLMQINFWSFKACSNHQLQRFKDLSGKGLQRRLTLEQASLSSSHPVASQNLHCG